jgi:hypothetical protein
MRWEPDELDLVDVYAEPEVTCLECGAALDDDELVLGAFCHGCRPFNHQPSAIGETHARSVEYVSRRIRERFGGGR